MQSQVTISHEFRTPLSSMLMLLESLLKNEAIPAGVRNTLWLLV